MINNIQPNSIVKEDFDNAMRNFCKKVTFNSHEYYKNTKMSYRPVYKPAGGRKYIKIAKQDNQTSVYCFVRAEDGAILKAATWKAPALNYTRGSIFDDVLPLSPYGVRY